MGIYKIAKDLQLLAINSPMVSQSCYGSIDLYNNKATIKYPYVNFDIVSTRITNNIAQYTFRIYLLDRNEPYVAYNKTKIILDSILKYYELDITNYIVYYSTMVFKDLVNGCYADFVVEELIDSECLIDDVKTSGFTLDFDYGIYEITNELVEFAKNINMVEGSNFGDIDLYDNKATTKYPYVNFDLVTSTIKNDSCSHIFRIYCMDRNEPYTAFNKTEIILNNILKHPIIDANNYTINYYTLRFRDIVNGCYADFVVETNVPYDCQLVDSENTFIITEDGDYIITEVDDKYIIKE